MQINEGIPKPVAYEEFITLTAGDTVTLVDLRYCAFCEALADSVGGEAYLFPNCDEHHRNCIETYENGLFTRGGPRIHSGCNDIGDFRGSWVAESGRYRLLVALVHYFGVEYEVDDRFYVNLNVIPP
jgi:hypothetical protein